jgi:hypothetical protein
MVIASLALLVASSVCMADGYLDTSLSKISRAHSTSLMGEKQEPPSPKAVEEDPHFVLIVAVGSGRDGYDSLRVNADGAAQFVYYRWDKTPDKGKDARVKTWWRATLQVSKEDVAALRQTVAANVALFRRKAYHADTLDGTQAWVKLTAGDRRVGVYCNNHFPRDLAAIHDFIKSRLGESLKAAMGQATRLADEELSSADLAEMQREPH